MGKIIVSSQFTGPALLDIAMKSAFTVCEEKKLDFNKIKAELEEQKTSEDFLKVYDSYFKDDIKILI
jgi:hypothetical protein